VSRLGLPLALLLLVIGAVIVAGSAVFDLRTRATSPEATVRRYFDALQAGDVDAALNELSPATRSKDSAFVEAIAGNEYRVVGIAVRSTSLFDQVRGTAPGPREVTVFLDVTETFSGDRWQATPRVPLVQDSGRWYLARAPLAPN
jgi:hypothetical protein